MTIGVGRLETRTRLLSAVFFGLVLGLFHSYIPQDGTAGTVLAMYYLVLAPSLFGFTSWPLRSYRVVGYVTFTGCVTAAAHNLYDWKNIYAFYGYTVWVVEFVIFWLLTMLLLIASVFVHRRYWPQFASGQCQTCGYDLRGSQGCCPECGTPFEKP